MVSALAPELKLLIVNAAALAVAYLGIYPSLKPLTLNRVIFADTVISLACLTVAGLLFYGSGVRFSMLLFETNWAFFSIVTLLVLELPIFAWFATRHDLWEPWDRD